jgi:hypothetical protein
MGGAERASGVGSEEQMRVRRRLVSSAEDAASALRRVCEVIRCASVDECSGIVLVKERSDRPNWATLRWVKSDDAGEEVLVAWGHYGLPRGDAERDFWRRTVRGY